MIFGNALKTSRRWWRPETPLLALGLFLLAGRAHGADLAIDELMAMLGQVRESSASFTEERTSTALTTPLTSSGTLRFVAPAHIEKHTREPKEELLVVDGDRITLDRPAENARRSLSIDEAPEIRAMVEAVRGTLTGDIQSLRRYYSVALQGQKENWRLTLAPEARSLREFLRVIRVGGSGATIRYIDTIETNGDVSHMAIETSSRS